MTTTNVCSLDRINNQFNLTKTRMKLALLALSQLVIGSLAGGCDDSKVDNSKTCHSGRLYYCANACCQNNKCSTFVNERIEDFIAKAPHNACYAK